MAALTRVDLVGIAGTQGIKDIEVVPGKTFVLGRADGNDVVIKKNDISRQHANLEIRDDQFVVTDLGSANGTRVNGHRISGAVLVNDGDEVEFGDRKFRAALVGAAAAAPALVIPEGFGNMSSEATAMWSPSSAAVATPEARDEDPADSPVDATQTFDAAALMPPPPPDPPKASAGPKFSTLTTGDISVVEDEPAATPGKKKKGRVGGVLFVAFVMLLMGVALVGAWLVVTGKLKGEPPVPTTSSPAWEYVPPPLAKATDKDVAELSGPDLQLYDRALYSYEIRNYLAARRELETLAKRYAGNKLISDQLQTVKQALSNEIDRLLAHGQDNMDFLKFREARDAFQGVLRLADQEDVRRQRAQDRLKELEKLVGQRRR